MTTPTTVDPVRAFRQALPRYVEQQLNDTHAVAAHVTRATNAGWTVPQLVEECTRDIDGVYKPGGLVTDRLRRAADRPPPGPAKATTRAFCSDDCRQRGGWIEDPKTGKPTTRCPCRTEGTP